MGTPRNTRRPARRSQGQGHLRERPEGSGRWQGMVYVGRNELSKPVYKSKTFKASSRSAADKLFAAWCTEMRTAYGAGLHSTEPLTEDVMTFDALLRHYYDECSSQWTPAGRRTHLDYIDGYLSKLGKLTPRQVTPTVWNNFCKTLLAKGGTTASGKPTKTKSGRLGRNTVCRMEAMVHAAFVYAIATKVFKGANPLNDDLATKWKSQVVEFSTSELVDTQAKDDRRTPERWEIDRLLAALPRVAPDAKAFVAFADSNGPRRGEILVLTLQDWDPARLEMEISKRLVAPERGGKETIVRGTKDGTKRDFRPRVVAVDASAAAILNTHIECCRLRAVTAEDPGQFAALCVEGRRNLGMSQTEVGAAVGLSQLTVSLLERGLLYNGRGNAAPAAAVIGALGDLFGLRWEEMNPQGALASNAFLFSPAPDGRSHWSLAHGGRLVSRLAVQIGLEPFGLQGIRSRVSTDLVDSGAGPQDLMAQMGHSYAVANEFYTKSTSVTRAAAMARRAAMRRSEPSTVVDLPARQASRR